MSLKPGFDCSWQKVNGFSWSNLPFYKSSYNGVVNCSRSNLGIVIKTKLPLKQLSGYLHLWYHQLRQKPTQVKMSVIINITVAWSEFCSITYLVYLMLISVSFNISLVGWANPTVNWMSEWLFSVYVRVFIVTVYLTTIILTESILFLLFIN